MPTSIISAQSKHDSEHPADAPVESSTIPHGLKALSPASLKAFFHNKLKRLKNFDSGFLSIGSSSPPSTNGATATAASLQLQQQLGHQIVQKTAKSLPPAVRVSDSPLVSSRTTPLSDVAYRPTVNKSASLDTLNNRPDQNLSTSCLESISEEDIVNSQDCISQSRPEAVLKKSLRVNCLAELAEADQLDQSKTTCAAIATESSPKALGRRLAGWWSWESHGSSVGNNTASSPKVADKRASSSGLSALISRKLKFKSSSSTSLISNTSNTSIPLSIPGSPPAALTASTRNSAATIIIRPTIIKDPGSLPRSAQSKIQPTTVVSQSNGDAASEERNDDQYKRARRQDILSILRGRAQLPSELAEKYEMLALLGDGAFGYVFAAKLRGAGDGSAEVAVKFIDKASVPSRSWVKDDVYGYIPFEAHFLKQINHPNIIRFHDLYADAKYVYLVTDLHGTEWRSDNHLLNPVSNPGLRDSHGIQSPAKQTLMAIKDLSGLSDDELLERRRTACDLFECIDAHLRMPEDTVKFIFAQILDAICYLADLGFVHRDLKDENIVIDQYYRIKLIDFGSCSRIPAEGDESNYFDSFNGTLHFASPEILMGKAFRGPEAEVWALGVLLYTLIYSENPFANTETILENRVRYRSRYEDANQLIRLMFEPLPEKRIKLSAIRKHPWICKYFGESSGRS